jgi:glycosyltransferase involved in cell wall biosynthesis
VTYTLVIPTRGRPEFVEQAVASALAQSKCFDEIIVVLDGAENFMPEFRNGPVRVVQIEHAGVAVARNVGVAEARSDWVCFLDDDDLLHPHYLAAIDDARGLDARRRAMSTWYWRFSAGGDESADFHAESLQQCLAAAQNARPRTDMGYLDIEGRSFDMLLDGLRGSMSTTAIDRMLLLNAGGFPAGYTSAEDWTMYVNVSRFAEWHVVRERLGFFRDHVTTNTRSGGTRNGLMMLRAIDSFWRESSLPVASHRPISAYRIPYRRLVETTLAAARARGDRQSYEEARRLAHRILPRRIDRMRAAVPAPLRRILRTFRNGS